MSSIGNEIIVETVLPKSVQELFEVERIQFPPVPANLADLLRQNGPALFATKPLQQPPYDLAHYPEEFEIDPDRPAYALVGFDGHGISSWAAHYYVVNDGLAGRS